MKIERLTVMFVDDEQKIVDGFRRQLSPDYSDSFVQFQHPR